MAVVLEDLHWADATSLQLLERLVGDTEDEALLLICTGCAPSVTTRRGG